jgi:hypothetical protein
MTIGRSVNVGVDSYFRNNHAFGRAGIKDDLSQFLREARKREDHYHPRRKTGRGADRLRVQGRLARLSARERPALSAPHRARAKELARGARHQDRGCRVRTPRTEPSSSCHRNPCPGIYWADDEMYKYSPLELDIVTLEHEMGKPLFGTAMFTSTLYPQPSRYM